MAAADNRAAAAARGLSGNRTKAPMDWIAFARGPALHWALAIMVFGLCWRLGAFIFSPPEHDLYWARKQFWLGRGHWQIESYVMHVGLLIVLFGFAPHILLVSFEGAIGFAPFPESECPDVRHFALQIEHRGHHALLHLLARPVETHTHKIVPSQWDGARRQNRERRIRLACPRADVRKESTHMNEPAVCHGADARLSTVALWPPIAGLSDRVGDIGAGLGGQHVGGTGDFRVSVGDEAPEITQRRCLASLRCIKGSDPGCVGFQVQGRDGPKAFWNFRHRDEIRNATATAAESARGSALRCPREHPH